MKILVVEDQEGPLGGFRFSLGQALAGLTLRGATFDIGKIKSGGMIFNGVRESVPSEDLVSNTGKGALNIAKWYSQAEEYVKLGGYDLVFLDHRMPRENPGCTDDKEKDRFYDQLENIGYGLIPTIRKYNPNAVIVGTSSMKNEIEKNFQKPDYQIEKGFDMVEEIKRVLKESKLEEAVK